VPTLIVVVAVAVAYFALGEVSRALAYAPTDAWTVWLAGGLTLGLLLATARNRWIVMLAGAALGAAVFALTIGSDIVDALGYAVIEVVGAWGGAWIATRIVDGTLRLDSPRELGALTLGAGVQSLIGAALATGWTIATGGQQAWRTFNVWLIAALVGAILVAPLVITWSGFRPKRSGGLTMPQFAAGAVACALFIGTLYVLFSPGASVFLSGSVETGLTYLPVVFMGVIAVTWGARGASLSAFAGALIALFNTIRENGPFAVVDEFVGEAELEVQVFVAAVALTGLIIAALAARERRALREAREWRARFEGAITAHRLIAYEWDPVGGAFAVTGDTVAHLGVPAAKIATLADWLAAVAPAERDRIATAFGLRGEGSVGPRLAYGMIRADGTTIDVVDEAAPVRDHDGSLYRITGVVHVAGV
jgi:integral membrane sensor domain MASE1